MYPVSPNLNGILVLAVAVVLASVISSAIQVADQRAPAVGAALNPPQPVIEAASITWRSLQRGRRYFLIASDCDCCGRLLGTNDKSSLMK